MIMQGVVLMIFALCAALSSASADHIQLYVAKNGNDSWSGTRPEPNRTHTDGPFASLERARDAVRELKRRGKLPAGITINIRKGTYYLDRTFELTSEDSGAADCPVVYQAYPGEVVTISGGKEIEGFGKVTVSGRAMIAAQIPEVREGKWYFTQLFVNGRRRPRTRLPKEGFYQIESLIDADWDSPWNQGQDKFRFKQGEIKQWRNLSDVEIVALHFWVESRMPIQSVDETQCIVNLAKKSVFRLSEEWNKAGARYYVENVFEALNNPGQWYLDRPTGTLYYYPAVGEDWQRSQFVAPRLCRLVEVIGSSDHPVTNVHFKGITFSHTEYLLPPEHSGAAQAAHTVPGAIYFEHAVNCTISECEVSGIGNYAVEIGQGCKACAVEKCLITDLGAGGIKIDTGSEGTVVSDNEISDGGKIYLSAVGVLVMNSPYNKIVHNNIHDLNYTGVSVGWVWGYGPSNAKGNIVEQNHIHHVGRGMLSDLGGIYTLGIQPGTVLRNNLIHDCFSHGYGGWGIYTDEGSSEILIENNIVYKTKTGGFHQHYGKENVVRNNIFAFAQEHQLQRTRQEQHISFFFERNIVYYNSGVLLGANWSDDNFKMDYNVYWNASGRPITFAGATFDEWKKRGHDVHSLIADPKFVDAEHFDFRVKPDSPAVTLGFRNIDVSQVGPRKPVGPPNKLSSRQPNN
ncbi:MAG: right-handed parallel beta-helix repeat-containing protein [Armatimonadota bacterium]|nr:right-handed parallel beta-helix repeat-containing protein [Armatimonadota bacterium]